MLTTTINAAPLIYTVTAADTDLTIAAAIVAAVNASAIIDPLSGLAVNALVTAALDGVVKIQGGLHAEQPHHRRLGRGNRDDDVLYRRSGRLGLRRQRLWRHLRRSSQKLLVHEPFLCAACNLTGAEFAQIVQALGFDLTTPLNLANVSALYPATAGWRMRWG